MFHGYSSHSSRIFYEVGVSTKIGVKFGCWLTGQEATERNLIYEEFFARFQDVCRPIPTIQSRRVEFEGTACIVEEEIRKRSEENYVI